MDLYNSKSVEVRTKHHCFLCNLDIKPGTTCIYEKGKYDGEFFSRYSHHECSEQWQRLNVDQCQGDDWGMLEDHEFDLENHKANIKEKYNLGEV